MSMKKYEEWNANHKHDNPPREKIVKLGRKITDCLLYTSDAADE